MFPGTNNNQNTTKITNIINTNHLTNKNLKMFYKVQNQ